MSNFWRLAKRLLRRKGVLIAALAMAFLSAASLGGGLLGIVQVLEAILGDGESLRQVGERFNASSPIDLPASWLEILPQEPFETVVVLVLALGALTVFGATANFLHAYFALTASTQAVASVRRDAFRTVVHLPLGGVVGRTQQAISRILHDSTMLLSGFNSLTSKAVASITKGVAALGAAIVIEWRLTLAALVVAPLLYTIVRKLGKTIRRASRGAMRAQASLLEVATESLQGLRVVKVYTNERYEVGRFSRLNRDVVREQLRARTARALAGPLTETVTMVIIGALALVAAKQIIDGSMAASSFIVALASLGVAGSALKPLTRMVQELQASDAAATRIVELLDADPEPAHLFRGRGAPPPRLPRHRESIRFEGVSFTYPDAHSQGADQVESDRPALDGVSLDISHGETVAFVGPNGCGKTTLLSLLPRLFEPDKGRVLIDGVDIAQVSLRSLRRQIGVVTQEVVLFRATIAENIAYADRSASRERIEDAARRAGAEAFILEKPRGYESVVGEQGLSLSGGQRQRLAIARAVLRDPSILILDEATSMIDAESEQQIGEAVAAFSKGRTCLVVAHRLSTILQADRIVVMDQGHVVDAGEHEALLERCAVYRRIARTQMAPAGA